MLIAKSIIILLIVSYTVQVVIKNDDSESNDSLDYAYDQLISDIEKAELICHGPNINPQCKASHYHIFGYEIIGWYIIKPERTCRPLWGLVDENSCRENIDLPQSQDECEYLCLKKPCQVIRFDNIESTEIGYCSTEEYCNEHIAHKHYGHGLKYNPCNSEGKICCPQS